MCWFLLREKLDGTLVTSMDSPGDDHVTAEDTPVLMFKIASKSKNNVLEATELTQTRSVEPRLNLSCALKPPQMWKLLHQPPPHRGGGELQDCSSLVQQLQEQHPATRRCWFLCQVLLANAHSCLVSPDLLSPRLP